MFEEDEYLRDIDELDPIEDEDIIIPEAEYSCVGNIGMKDYMGETVPFPLTLLMYLRGNEIKIMSLLLWYTKRNGVCHLTIRRISELMGITAYNVRKILLRLEGMGLLKIEGTSVREKTVLYNTIRTLDDIAQTRKPGVIPELRCVLGNGDIRRISEKNMRRLRNYEYLDEVEAEEYN